MVFTKIVYFKNAFNCRILSIVCIVINHIPLKYLTNIQQKSRRHYYRTAKRL